MKKSIIAIFITLFFPITVLAQSPPELTITQSGQTAPGVVFLTPNNNYVEIISNDSRVLYQDQPGQVFDFKVQPDGTLSYVSHNEIVNLARNYQVIETVQAIGYPKIDVHEVVKIAPDHWLYLIYNEIEHYDLSPYGGLPDATLVSTVIQEQQNGMAIFEWHDIDYVPISDTTSTITGSTRLDYTHGNALDIIGDAFLVSLPAVNQILKIDRQTGDVIWRLGGNSNQFTFTNDGGFAFQHHIRQIDENHITLFDNNGRGPNYSRAVEYEINEAALTITRTMEITGPWASCCGDAQRLSNGNIFVNWGNAGVMSEHTPDGAEVWRAEFESGFTYRAFRQEFPAWRVWMPVIRR